MWLIKYSCMSKNIMNLQDQIQCDKNGVHEQKHEKMNLHGASNVSKEMQMLMKWDNINLQDFPNC